MTLPMTSEFMEAFCMGFNASRAGVPSDDGEAFLAAMADSWERTGGRLAQKVHDGTLTEGVARAMIGGQRAF
jgi:hypothetical protein